MKNTLIKKVFIVGVCVVLFGSGTSAFGATVYMPHLTGGNLLWEDWLQVDNGDSSNHDFTVTLYNGGIQVYTGIHTVAGYGHTEMDIKTYDGTATTGIIEYDSDALLFRVSYEYVSTGAVAEFSLSDTLSRTLGFLFSGFVSTVNAKGAAIANMSDTPAYVTLYAVGGDTILGTYSTTIGAHDQIVGVHNLWFPYDSFSEIDSIIAVSSVKCLSGVVICTENPGLSYLLFTPGITVPVFDPSGASDFTTWAFSAGGSDDERGRCIRQTADGGYVVTGDTQTYGAGSNDFWVIKCDSAGGIQWQKTYGGSADDGGQCIQQTSDGGYVVAGHTYSYGTGGCDMWVLKLDSAGTISWQKTYGGSSTDYCTSIRQTTDGGYIAAGYTASYGSGMTDLWILKLGSLGNTMWQKAYGGNNLDIANNINQTTDGGYIVTGYTKSYGAGNDDFWVIKLDSVGTIIWQKTYGGSYTDRGKSVQQTSDGGYVVAGYTSSYGAGSYDLWILKLDVSGKISWQKTYGGSSHDYCSSIQQTTDGGYIVIGDTHSYGAGEHDLWLLKLDASGSISCQKTFGGSSDDISYSVCQSSDGGYIVSGRTESFSAGDDDLWILKLESSGDILGCGTSVSTDTAISPANSTCIPAYTLISPVSVSATVTTTYVSGIDSDADVSFQCSE